MPNPSKTHKSRLPTPKGLLTQSARHASNPARRRCRPDLGRRQCTKEAGLRGNALDAVGGVEVLDEGDLVAGGGTLAGYDGGVGEEEFPDLDGVWILAVGFGER